MMIPENELMQDAEIIYHYRHVESGRRYIRTFKISEIKDDEDNAHLLTIPGFVFVGMSYPENTVAKLAMIFVRAVQDHHKNGVPGGFSEAAEAAYDLLAEAIGK